MTISVAEFNPGHGGQRSSKSSKKTSSKTISSSKSNHDVRAMRHLRSLVESIAADENLSQTERYRKISNFKELLYLAEKKMQVQDDQSLIPNNNVAKNVEQKNKRGWLKTRLLGNQSSIQTYVVAPVKENTEQLPTDQKVETISEAVQESRDDVNVRRYDDITGQQSVTANARELVPESMDNKVLDSESATAPLFPGQGGDNNVDTCTDSIMGLRMQNSEDYVASVCSLRSLGTFERDFINNIVAEQMANKDQVSVSTFERDFLARQVDGGNMAHPTQVFIRGEFINPDAVADDLTLGTMLSETTFEQDARSIIEPPKVTPPVEITAASGENDIFDDLSIGSCRSETTFDRQLHMRNEPCLEARGSAPTTYATFDTFNNGTVKITKSIDSQISVSTYEKDMAALDTLAKKIGRTPSMTTTASDRSCSTFEKDTAMRADMMAKSARVNTAHNTIRNSSEQPTSTFEKDYHARSSSKQRSLAAMSEAAAAAHNARWTNSFSRMGIKVTEAGTVLPKISPLAVELSPNTIEKEVKLREREGTLWGKFACFAGW